MTSLEIQFQSQKIYLYASFPALSLISKLAVQQIVLFVLFVQFSVALMTLVLIVFYFVFILFFHPAGLHATVDRRAR